MVDIRRHIRSVSVAAVAALLVVYVYCQFQLIESGRLFIFALPFDAKPSTVELHDAKATARAFQVPAMGVVVVIGLLLTYAVATDRRLIWPSSTRWRWAAIGCIVAAIADAATTVYFFHTKGIDFELHPAIRLFGYAYGRTVGPLLGKLVQLIGVLCLSSFNEKGGSILLWIVSGVYLLAAIYNAIPI